MAHYYCEVEGSLDLFKAELQNIFEKAGGRGTILLKQEQGPHGCPYMEVSGGSPVVRFPADMGNMKIRQVTDALFALPKILAALQRSGVWDEAQVGHHQVQDDG